MRTDPDALAPADRPASVCWLRPTAAINPGSAKRLAPAINTKWLLMFFISGGQPTKGRSPVSDRDPSECAMSSSPAAQTAFSRDRISGSETHPQFHRWPVPAALLGAIPSERQPGDGAGHRRDRGKRPRRRRCRRRRGVPRVRVVAQDTRRGTIPAPDPGCRAHRGELRRAGAARIGRQREADRARPPDGRAPSHPELSLLCDGDPARRNALPHHGRPGAQLHHPAAPRRRRADLTLEPAAVPSDLEDRSGHRRRELLCGEAFGADTADRRHGSPH